MTSVLDGVRFGKTAPDNQLGRRREVPAPQLLAVELSVPISTIGALKPFA
jgi:hypothetical protein